MISGAEGPMAVVVDASAMAALLFGEPAGERVAGMLAERRLIGPTLLRYELASVLRKKLNRHPERRDELVQVMSAWSRLPLDEVQAEPAAVASLAEELDVTACDAAYLWLGRLAGAAIVTLDDAMSAAARRLGLPAV